MLCLQIYPNRISLTTFSTADHAKSSSFNRMDHNASNFISLVTIFPLEKSGFASNLPGPRSSTDNEMVMWQCHHSIENTIAKCEAIHLQNVHFINSLTFALYQSKIEQWEIRIGASAPKVLLNFENHENEDRCDLALDIAPCATSLIPS